MTEHAGSCMLAMNRCGGAVNTALFMEKHNQQQLFPLLLRLSRLPKMARREREQKDESQLSGLARSTYRTRLVACHFGSSTRENGYRAEFRTE
jgi:hypothetical protein